MTTLRRELRIKFDSFLNRFDFYNNLTEADQNLVLDGLAHEALELRGFRTDDLRPELDFSKMPMDWKILAGLPITEEDFAEIEKEALDTFERDMQTPGNWNWYPAKGSEEKAWKYLREFVVKLYKENQKSFQAYQTWRTQPFAKGAMSNLAIKRNPENFPASWTDFLASNAMYGHKIKRVPQEERTDLDDQGIPMSY